MNDDLYLFLSETDLDELLTLRRKLSPLDENDVKSIVTILREGKKKQAAPNLLFYPDLIPEPERLRILFGAIEKRDKPYCALAAIVGLQGIDPESMTPEEKRRSIELLLNWISIDKGLIAERCTVTLFGLAGEDEIPQMTRELGHSNETVRRNILSILIHVRGQENIENWIDMLKNVSPRAKLSALALLREAAELPFGLDLLSTPLLSFIPNRKDFR